MRPGPKLILATDGGRRVVPILKGRLTVGRAGDQDISLSDRKISGAHALLEKSSGGYRVRDLASTNGTYVNGVLVEGTHALHFGDEVRFGNTRGLFTDLDPREVDWPGTDSELDQGSDTEPQSQEGPQTVKFRVQDIERGLFDSEESPGSLGSLQRRLQVLYRMTALTRRPGGSIDNLLDQALKLVLEVSDADRGAFFLVDQATQKLVPHGVRDRHGPTEAKGISRTILKQVRTTGEAIISRDAQADERFEANQSILSHNIRSALAVPLHAQTRTQDPSGQPQSEVLGVLHLDKRSARRPFESEDLQLAVIVAQQAAATIANLRLFEAISLANKELERARDEILRWNQELEGKVAERTQEVQEQAERIADLSRQKDQLLGMVAHDLRTPLTGMLGFAEVAISDLQAGSATEHTLEDLLVIRQSAQEMSELLNDLLDVSRLEAGKIRIELRPVDIGARIRTDRRRYEMWASSKEIGFTAKAPSEELWVSADPKRIQQVLNNLVSNAIKYSTSGGMITLRVKPAGKEVEVSVQDTGQGIASDDLDKVFASYEQTKTQATAGEHGAGLGLSIAKKLVELHGGQIWVESKPGVGSRFTFSLQRTSPPSATGDI
ncbi:MAG: FHA domain-containing protein [Planctomycetes bacterium]|nr:FHA domain-containing protein [Planctomycetota bacterium]